MPNSADRAEVEAVWRLTHQCDGSYRDYPRGTILIQQAPGKWLDFPSWSVAAAFTHGQLRQIQRYRIIEIKVRNSELPQGCIEFLLNILHRDLAELLKGMKP